MEQEVEIMMKVMVLWIENYFQFVVWIGQYVQEIQGQVVFLWQCIEVLGGSVFIVKGLFVSMIVVIYVVGNILMEDEVVKSVGFLFGFENIEIVMYWVLVIVVECVGVFDIVVVCGQILQEEVVMVCWLEDYQDGLVGVFFNCDEMFGVQVKC